MLTELFKQRTLSEALKDRCRRLRYCTGNAKVEIEGAATIASAGMRDMIKCAIDRNGQSSVKQIDTNVLPPGTATTMEQ